MNSRGDTIVEVILATAVIASAIGLTVAMSNRNLQNGVAAAKRSEALALAQEQVEHIKNAYTTNSSRSSLYKVEADYCILGDGSTKPISDNACLSYNGTQYSLKVDYNPSSRVFSVTSYWQPASSDRQVGDDPDKLNLYYKLPAE